MGKGKILIIIVAILAILAGVQFIMKKFDRLTIITGIFIMGSCFGLLKLALWAKAQDG